MSKRKKEFPPRILVTREESGDNSSFLSAHDDSTTDFIEHGQHVATYELVDVGVMEVTRSIKEVK